MGSLFEWVHTDKNRTIDNLKHTIRYLNESVESEKYTVKELSSLVREQSEELIDQKITISKLKEYIAYYNEYINQIKESSRYDISIGFVIGLIVTALFTLFLGIV